MDLNLSYNITHAEELAQLNIKIQNSEELNLTGFRKLRDSQKIVFQYYAESIYKLLLLTSVSISSIRFNIIRSA
jgi:hypothetical protein